MTAFPWVCVGYFLMWVCFDLADLRKRNNPIDWLFLVLNTGMAAFAANALWGHF